MNAAAIDFSILPRRRIRPIRQAEAAECGLASLAMIANHAGADLDLGALRRRFGVSSRGMGLRQLMQTADSMGLATRPLKVDLEGLAGVELPAILHWDMDHFVVLERLTGGRAYIVDPAKGPGWHDRASLSKHFTGVALEVRPTSTFDPVQERRPVRLRQLWSGVSGFKRSLAQVVLLSLILQAHVLAAPYLLQVAIDQALPALDLDLLQVVAIGFALFALINAAASLLRGFVLLASGTAISYGIASNVARRLLRLPVAWFEKRAVGDILSRFQSIAPIERLLTESASAALIDGALAALTLALMAVYSPALATIPLIGLALYAGFRLLTVGAERRAEAERIAATGREQSAMIESLRGIVTLRLAGRETMRHARWQNRLSEALDARYAHERIRQHQAAFSVLVQALENVAVIYFAVRLAIGGGFSVGMIFAFLAYRLQFATATKRLVDEGMEFRLLNLHLDRLSDIALEPEDGGSAETAAPREAAPAGITVSNVTYAYGETDPDVLTGIDLSIAAGEHVAITGPSGGGKTTLVKLLLGLLDPKTGSVAIDDVPLARYGRRNYREHVGAVLQDDLLFAGTIAENVAGFDEIDPARLQEAFAAAAIADDIAAMPMRHMTLVGDMGSSLSGGQRQRILLARALYRRPSILVMDEGTAHLDAEHERRVNAAIAAMGITRIIVAHRHETIAAADRIVTIAGGKVVSDVLANANHSR